MYLGQTGYGLVMLFTFGFLGIGQLVDLFLIPNAVKHANRLTIDAETLTKDKLSHEKTWPTQLDSQHSTNLRSIVNPAKDDELDVLLDQAKDSVARSINDMNES